MGGDSPRRGEVWLVNFNPGRGREQKGMRPALVIQNDTGNRYAATTIVAAITTTIKLFPMTVSVPASSAGLRRDCMVNLAQVLTIDKSRLARMIGTLSPELVQKVDSAIRISLEV